MAREINLVPDVKNEMIKALKMRNLIFFFSIIIAAGSVIFTLLVGSIMGGQQIALTGKQSTLDKLSAKLNSYDDLGEFLTFQGQMNNIDGLISNKKVLSRAFNVLSAILPTGVDTIKISEVSVRLDSTPSFTFNATANAGAEPYIDYNVLDSFKKSMQYMRYDHGNYVDMEGNSIPAYCMIETGPDGTTFVDSQKGIYAFWDYTLSGCDTTDAQDGEGGSVASDYIVEEYSGKKVVRIWRTPQYTDWYSEDEIEGKPYMSLSGEISNVAHFESACISYTGTLSSGSSSPTWKETNESCLLVPDGANGIKIVSSSNARDGSLENSDLVLMFDAIIYFNPEVFSFSNKHVLAIGPSGRYNVTDSYVQIQSMFSNRATECTEDDSACQSNTENLKGGE